MSWHLDPMILKQDVAQVLREFIYRPFLSLKTEIYESIDWRSKIISYVHRDKASLAQVILNDVSIFIDLFQNRSPSF